MKKQDDLTQETTDSILTPEYQTQLKQEMSRELKSKKLKNVKKLLSDDGNKKGKKSLHIDQEDAEMIADSLLGSS